MRKFETFQALIRAVKNAFVAGGSDPRAWDQSTLDDTPVAHFGDVLYVQVLFAYIERKQIFITRAL